MVTVHALYGTDFFLSGASADGRYRVSEFAVRPDPVGSRCAVLREIVEGRRVAGYARGEQSSPFIRRSSLYTRRKRQTSRKNAPLPFLLLIERKIQREDSGEKIRSPIITAHRDSYNSEESLSTAPPHIRRHRSYFYDDEIELTRWIHNNKSAIHTHREKNVKRVVAACNIDFIVCAMVENH